MAAAVHDFTHGKPALLSPDAPFLQGIPENRTACGRLIPGTGNRKLQYVRHSRDEPAE